MGSTQSIPGSQQQFQKDNSSPDAWDGCPDEQQAWLSPPGPGAAGSCAGKGWKGCGRAGRVFLCHRKQLPGVSQAGSGLPELLSQPANGKGCCVQTLRRNGSVTWNISGCSLGLRAGFEPSPCPIPSACTEPPVCCSPEPGFAAGSLSLGEPGRLPSTLGGGSKGHEEVIPKHPGVCTEGAVKQLFAEIPVFPGVLAHLSHMGALKQREGSGDSSPPTLGAPSKAFRVHPGDSQGL